MPKLYHLAARPEPLGTVTLIRDTHEPLEYEEIKAEGNFPSGILEHVNIGYRDEEGTLHKAHLFCDDNGHAFALPPNLRATLLYANPHLIREYTFDEILNLNEESRIIFYSDFQIIRKQNLIIVGDCLLWTGELE